jgi:hypothetical protein
MSGHLQSPGAIHLGKWPSTLYNLYFTLLASPAPLHCLPLHRNCLTRVRPRTRIRKFSFLGLCCIVNCNHGIRKSHSHVSCGVPRNFVRGGVQQIQLRTEENGDLGAVAPYSGVLEAAVIWYKEISFHIVNFSYFFCTLRLLMMKTIYLSLLM